MLEAANPPSTGSEPARPLKYWLLQDLAEARRELEAADTGGDVAIHQARRRLKRVRTLFSVLKPVTSLHHRQCGETAKAAFKQLSGRRDADAMLKAARWLAGRTGPALRPAARALAKRLKLHLAAARTDQVPVADTERLLRIAEADAASLPEALDTTKLLRDHLIATYRKGRKLYRLARSGANGDHILHDWRKQVKHRLHLGQIVAAYDLFEAPFPAEDLDRLADQLGDEHDFATLSAWIKADPVLGETPETTKRLVTAIDRRRARLTERALQLGADLYGDRTRRFARQLTSPS